MWEPRYEAMPRPELESLQLERLKYQVRYVYERVPFYKTQFDQAGINPNNIKSLADISQLPFTSKSDFRDNYPFGLTATPLSKVVRVHASSGTTGRPIIAPYSARDIETWANLMARNLSAAGLSQNDVMQNAYGYGLFTGGLGFHYGAERMGITVIPTSVGNTKRQLQLIADLDTTALACTPSYALVLAEAAQEISFDLAATKLRVALCGAEPWTEKMRSEIEAKAHLTALDTYGLTELIGPGVSSECPHKSGLHIWEDHFLAEVVDPTTNQPLSYGEQGELVLTTLTKEAQPVIRFRTRDLVTLNPEKCVCGRTMTRMSKVRGRTDDMLIIRGVNVFPTQIEAALLSIEGIAPYYQIIIDRKGHLDDIEIQAEVSALAHDSPALNELAAKAQSEVASVLGISAKVTLVKPRTIARTEGKSKRVIDRRQPD